MARKMQDLEQEAMEELEEEKTQLAKDVLKERIEEIQRTKKLLTKLEGQYKELLDKDVNDILE